MSAGWTSRPAGWAVSSREIDRGWSARDSLCSTSMSAAEEGWAERAGSEDRDDMEAGPSAVGEDEAVWLAARFGREGRLQENERALLRFIRDEATSFIPSPLQSLIDKAA